MRKPSSGINEMQQLERRNKDAIFKAFALYYVIEIIMY